MDESNPSNIVDPIAVVGMSCRFPGEATDISKFWELLNKARDAWSEIPKERFNRTSFWDPDSSLNGTVSTKSGHFLTEDVSRFDAPFFNISPAEAKAMDPQLRLLLEVAYEAFENAGWSIESLKGSDTSVYTALYNRDYEKMIYRDPDYFPFYFGTGNGEAMFSNRLSYYFDLRGPSFTLDTGCSGGLVALHNACKSIWTGDSRQSIVGGSNLMLDPASMIGPNFLQFYAPDGRSYAFDHRASGYGRGEGTACVVLKRLSDALADGDAIRAVIRSCAVNQDGRTQGITAPNPQAQEALVRKTYAMAGLDLARTVYVEAHGSGTSLGDSIESTTLSKIFKRDLRDGPLLVGSVKTNIGHLENVSGLAALIKAILIIEKGCIPPSLNFEKPAPGSAIDDSKLEVVTTHRQLRDLGSSQISVNSFGYGGTNAHLVLDAPYQHEVPEELLVAPEIEKTSLQREYLFVLSARSNESGQMFATRLQEYLTTKPNSKCQDTLASLAYTLCQRRSLLPWRATVVAESIYALRDDHLRSPLTFKCAPECPPKVAFVFTGQGSQWHAMGRELIKAGGKFSSSMHSAEKILLDLGADWKLTEELQQSPDASRLNDALIAQPSCTAIQLSLVDMLTSWNITPSGVTGHSSGEIAAAYACKAISFEDALGIAYARGRAVRDLAANESTPGGMLAVGMAEKDAMAYINHLPTSFGGVQVACINSPRSVTLSGDEPAIIQLYTDLASQGVFVRRLPVNVAYHSHHMLRAAPDYRAALSDLQPSSSSDIPFFSSVEGCRVEGPDLNAEYWVKNLTMPVRFEASFSELYQALSKGSDGASTEHLGNDNVVVLELGPHSAMKGPIKQIMDAPDLQPAQFQYISALIRNESATKTALAMAGDLLTAGLQINLEAANFGDKAPKIAKCLTDLPSYSWDHSTSFWHESRLSRNYRKRQNPPHALLGVLTPDSSMLDLRWRKYVRISEMPWLYGHMVSDRIIFPGAGFLCMAMEAVLYYAAEGAASSAPPQAVKLSDVSFIRPIVVPASGDPVEMILSFRPSSTHKGRDLSLRHEFIITSSSDGDEMSENCRGFVKILAQAPEPPRPSQESEKNGEYQIDPASMYAQLKQLGNQYSGRFCGISMVSASTGYSRVTVDGLGPNGQDPKRNRLSVMHPATLDACFQSIFPAVMTDGILSRPMMPTGIKEATIWNITDGIADQPCEVVCHVDKLSSRTCTTSINGVVGGRTILSITSLEATVTGGDAPSRDTLSAQLCQKLILTVDPDLLKAEDTTSICQASLTSTTDHRNIALLARVCRYFVKKALPQMSDADVASMQPHLKEYLTWLRAIVGDLEREVPSQENDHQDAQIEELEGGSYEGRMVCRIGRHLTSILQGTENAISLMMEDGLLHQIYRNDPTMKRCAVMAGEHARLLGFKNPSLRILEIGAGTGGATIHMLKALGNPDRPMFQQYTFTDISAGFFPKAKETFADWSRVMEYRTLNIEDPPEDQGFKTASYDLIIAANVLHATTHIQQTLRHVRRLLRPGGKLHLLESTRPSIPRSFVYGTLPGWWLGSQQRKKNHPLLSTEEWGKALKEESFSGIDCCLDPYEEIEDQTDNLLISTALAEPHSFTDDIIPIILTEGQMGADPTDPAYRLATQLSQSAPFKRNCIFSLGDLAICNRVCICLAGLSDSWLTNLDEQNFEALKSTMRSAKEVIWVTRGASGDCPNPQAALFLGLARVLRRENPDVRIVTVDLDAENTLCDQTLADALLHFLSHYPLICEDGNTDWTEREGRWLIPRLVLDDTATRSIHLQLGNESRMPLEIEPVVQTPRSLRLALNQSDTLQDLHFVDNLSLDDPIGENEVEIDVRATGVNFRDIMILLGQMDSEMFGECSGIVVNVGRNYQTQFSPGDRVYSCGVVGHASRVRAPAHLTHRIPAPLSFAEAASLPVVCNTAYYSLVMIAQLRRGETVLIHAGAGGVGQAAIQLALHIGAVVFTTVGSDAKRALLIEKYGIPPSHIFSTTNTEFVHGIRTLTGGVGVDVVLNSLAGPFLAESLGIVAPIGRFVEIGKSDALASTRLDMAFLQRGVSLTLVDIRETVQHKPDVATQFSSEVHNLVLAGGFRPLTPLHQFPVSRIEEAFRHFQGRIAGKVVLTYGVDDKVKVLPRKPEPLQLSPDGTYVVAGGQGGLGRAICSWLARLGAKYIVTLSPSGSKHDSTQRLIEELAQMGTHLRAICCDISNSRELDAALNTCRQELPQIRGVIQGALRLKDSTFENMSHNDYAQVLGPKVHGTYGLHNALASDPLDFFIILSSYSGLIGNLGQANYAAASTFQDAFARWRTMQGRPTRSINLGPIEGAGYLHEKPDALENLRQAKLESTPLDRFLALLRYAVTQPIEDADASQIGIVRLSGQPGASNGSRSPGNPFFGHMLLQKEIPSEATAGELLASPGLMMSEALTADNSTQEAVSKIQTALSHYVSGLTGVPLREISVTRSITYHGGDSLITVEFRNWLRQALGSSFIVGKDIGKMSLQELAFAAAELRGKQQEPKA